MWFPNGPENQNANPKPQTPKPKTQNPKPKTQNPKPKPTNPQILELALPLKAEQLPKTEGQHSEGPSLLSYTWCTPRCCHVPRVCLRASSCKRWPAKAMWSRPSWRSSRCGEKSGEEWENGVRVGGESGVRSQQGRREVGLMVQLKV